MNVDTLWTYTIYHQPELWPPYRMRPFAVRNGQTVPSSVTTQAATLELIRLTVPPQADVCLARAQEDPPEIVEVWM